MDIPDGKISITVEAKGFRTAVHEVEHRASAPSRIGITLQVGSISETVEVSAAKLQTSTRIDRPSKDEQKQASVNVINLQRRVAGVLPIQVDVPRTGNSYRFARPLVVDEETRVTFSYKAGR